MQQKISPRIENLRNRLMLRAFSDRSGEWINKQKLPDIAVLHPNEHVIVRRAYAIDAMLVAICDAKKFGNAHTFELEEGDLLAGTIPMGSNGLGKVFPNYLTTEELRIGSITNKTEMALLGHNSINYEKLLKHGLKHIIHFCEEKLKPKLRGSIEDAYDKDAFYTSVIISCQAVIDYAHRFAALAKKNADSCTDPTRKLELLEISRICNKVPEQPAETFYEAIHSIWLMHCSLHSTMDFMSLGRLDQVLNPYLKNEPNKEFARELMENFIIKAAGRINLTTQYLEKQDHMDYNAALGIHSYYIDQRAAINNFLQNVIIGGKLPNGKDATNPCTYLILDAFRNVNLSTPGIYVRLHKDSPTELFQAVSDALKETKNLPSILNDDVMIPAMFSALADREKNTTKLKKYQELANDYCVDGCWEPILNGLSEWTFGMINGLTILECTLNKGATLNPNPSLLRGQKLSIDTGSLTSFANLKTALTEQIQFFVDQSALAMYLYYMTTEFVVPSPLVSALFGTCLEKGRDKSWGGAEYNLGGTIVGGVPDMVNTIAAIKKWVFDKEKYQMQDVINALKYNFKPIDSHNILTKNLYESIQIDFNTNSPQFGNTSDVEDITKFILDEVYKAVKKSKLLADKVFLDEKGDSDPQIWALRAIAGYYGKSLQSTLPEFDLKFTVGFGTFEQYNWQGAGNAASAGRSAGAPLAPNFTPTSGTWHTPAAYLLESFERLNLDRFAAGIITDVCLESDALLEDFLRIFINKRGGMLTITIASTQYQEIYEIAKTISHLEQPTVAAEKLLKYADIVVRVGGWNAPFITLPLSHMENYVNRPVTPLS
ncbi:pyruvate formate lyase family protein [Williamwhitmania taraxaci]|uniref:Formate C-acetyltransferase n=1 Tax=Williamwhitmania taraxaci TaxID=1640674 RepID=A0A1G6GVE5_9BACT|nr:pyruvate formate lyase family protein [Williamwhitmania taraxaci]SDB85665.1 formate C-acetyltransferase [Williamwhitmania taraxaci]